MRTVRTTIEPHKKIKVSEAEYASLKVQGILVEDREPTPDSTSTPAAAPAPTPASTGKRSSEQES